MEKVLARFSLSLLPTLLLTAPAAAQGLVQGSWLGAGNGVGDVTGDGRADYVLPDPAIGPSAWQVHDGVTGAVLPYLTQPWGFSDKYFRVGDIDGDGHDDVCNHRVSPYGATIYSGADGSTLLPLPAATVYGSGDIDGDGMSDLLIVDSTPSTITTWIRSSRTGVALFTQAVPTGSIDNYYLIPMGDENGDGFDDAGLVATSYFFPAPVLVSVLRGPNATAAAIGVSYATACGDVDGDGDTDILVNPPLSSPYVLAGGTHAPIWTLTGLGAAIGVGDVDGDGFADLAATSSPIAMLSGATHAALPGTPPVLLPVQLGDIDGDGRVESVAGPFHYHWNDPALPIASRMLRRGTPGTTSSGRKPTIVTRGHCGLGHTMWFDIRGNEPDSLVVFAIGDAADVDLTFLGAPGNRAYTTMLGLSALLANGNGLAKLSAVMPTSPALLGATASVQAACFDAPANALGLVTSTAIDVETRN